MLWASPGLGVTEGLSSRSSSFHGAQLVTLRARVAEQTVLESKAEAHGCQGLLNVKEPCQGGCFCPCCCLQVQQP